MSEATYLSRATTIGLAGALIIGAVAVYFASQVSQGGRPEPRLIEVDCLSVERGPTLRFESGLLTRSGTVVGTYRFLAASPGKSGPSIEVEGIRVRQVGDRIAIGPGTEAWFWRYLDDDTVEMHFYPQNRAVAHRCTP
jgi:hypothetical protein